MKIGAARSVALLPASRAGLPISEYAPKRVKKAIVGTGNATKSQMQHMIQKILNIREQITPEDAADALGIAVCHLHNHQLMERLK
jgi:crossover junction endodeoxyribonuclease RuvC